jgi:hypothetical protein
MNKKYEKYINYIVNDIKPPYFINMKEMYGLKSNEYELVLSKVFNQTVKYGVTVKGYIVYDKQGNINYVENSNGYWEKREYGNLGNIIYLENSNGYWEKREYDEQGNIIYSEDSNGYISDRR